MFLGPLVFFHELGHFLFARFFGVRVEVFSIGFGPKLFKFKKGDTEYAFSLIPLGGYVKMFGDDPLNKDAIAECDRKFSFTFKNKWQRFWIVLGGPLANILVAYILFVLLFMNGERAPELKVGITPPQSKLFKYGFRSGDRILKVNNQTVSSPTDIALDTKDLINTMTVRGIVGERQLTIGMNVEKFFEEFVNYPGALRQPLVVNEKGNVFAVATKEKNVNWNYSFDEISHVYKKSNELFLYKYLSSVESDKFERKVDLEDKIVINTAKYNSIEELMLSEKIRPLDMSILSITMNSAADKANLKSGDVITKLNGINLFDFFTLKQTLQDAKGEQVELSFWRDGQEIVKSITPEIMTINEKKVKMMGVRSHAIYIAPKLVDTEGKGLVESLTRGFTRTIDSIVKTAEGFKKLIFAEVSFKAIGGPLSIGKVASDSFNTSLSQFFQLMALISINLGVINLFPIPVLDGGHILFIFLEIINRGPISKKKMMIAQQFGLSMLMILMVGAIFNDFSKFF
jgi:regulator of sigma E protease